MADESLEGNSNVLLRPELFPATMWLSMWSRSCLTGVKEALRRVQHLIRPHLHAGRHTLGGAVPDCTGPRAACTGVRLSALRLRIGAGGRRSWHRAHHGDTTYVVLLNGDDLWRELQIKGVSLRRGCAQTVRAG
ncbi:hypothetical protein FKP32DRAFT_273809 [Trametes sanguinea]|nr:hypothetical protein FKP32DRAFT_273809 [Trametes sanguinea]